MRNVYAMKAFVHFDAAFCDPIGLKPEHIAPKKCICKSVKDIYVACSFFFGEMEHKEVLLLD